MTSSNTLIDVSNSGEWEIENIELMRKLGSGSFSEVYESSWRGTPVAVKVISTQNLDQQEFVTEFLALTKLHHPNILQLFGLCLSKDYYKIVIERMSASLQNRNSKNTSLIEAVNISLDIARGLAYLHNRKPKCLIHRDLKPSNILLTTSGKAKIADFGISCFQRTSNELYEMTGETGSYRYMAPEVIKHEKYNSKVDIFSFSLILYTLCEEIPFLINDNAEICKQIISNIRPSFYELNLNTQHYCRTQLKHIISKCWSQIPDDRFDALIIIDKLQEIKNILDTYKSSDDKKTVTQTSKLCCVN